MVQLQSATSHRSDPVHRITQTSRVFCTEFSPFPWSSNLLAVGLQSSVVIGQCWFSEEDSSVPDFKWEVIQEVHHDTRVQGFAWSPKTSLTVAPKVLEFCTSGTDHKVRVFKSDLADVQVMVLKGHSDYVNTLVYEPEKGDLILTGSDDHTAKRFKGTKGGKGKKGSQGNLDGRRNKVTKGKKGSRENLDRRRKKGAEGKKGAKRG